MSRANRWKSEAQANAEALARRGTPYTEASSVSFTVSWDWHNREPRDLREAVRMVRAAYADEVPQKLHESAIGDDGTPRMHPQAEGYIFGSDFAGYERPDPETGQRPIADFYRTPFRALLSHWTRTSVPRAAIVSQIAVGGIGPVDATIRAGVPPWCAKLVAEDTLRAFLRSLSDVKLHLPKEDAAA